MTIKTIKKGMVNNVYEQDDEEINETILSEHKTLKSMSINTPAIEIIEIELRDLYRQVVTDGIMMDKDQTSKFEKLVKCLVSLQGGENKDEKGKKKKSEDVNALLKRVMTA